MGRKRTVNNEEIIRLREKGMPYEDIARIVGCSLKYAYDVAKDVQTVVRRNWSLCEQQEQRQATYPPDRIAFLPQAKDDDRKDMKMFAELRVITFDELRRRIALNNYLDTYFSDGRIPENMMKKELEMTGWAKWIK